MSTKWALWLLPRESVLVTGISDRQAARPMIQRRSSGYGLLECLHVGIGDVFCNVVPADPPASISPDVVCFDYPVGEHPECVGVEGLEMAVRPGGVAIDLDDVGRDEVAAGALTHRSFTAHDLLEPPDDLGPALDRVLDSASGGGLLDDLPDGTVGENFIIQHRPLAAVDGLVVLVQE